MGRLGKGRAESWSRRKQRRKKRQEVSATPRLVPFLGARSKLQPLSLVEKVHQKEGDQSKPTRTSYTSFPKEAGAPATQTRFYFVSRI